MSRLMDRAIACEAQKGMLEVESIAGYNQLWGC